MKFFKKGDKTFQSVNKCFDWTMSQKKSEFNLSTYTQILEPYLIVWVFKYYLINKSLIRISVSYAVGKRIVLGENLAILDIHGKNAFGPIFSNFKPKKVYFASRGSTFIIIIKISQNYSVYNKIYELQIIAKIVFLNLYQRWS